MNFLKHSALILALLFSGSLFAQTACSKYYPFTEGKDFQYAMYNKKGKEEGAIKYSIEKVNGDKATMAMTLFDKKGQEVITSDYDITCTGDGVRIDFKSMVPGQMLQQYESMGVEVDISGTDVELPNTLSEGQKLPDSNVNMKVKVAGMTIETKSTTTDRLVEKKEKVTTPAGTFDCVVLSQTNTAEVMGRTHETASKVWLAEGIGMIKQESYDDKGQLETQMVLTSLN